MFDRVRFLASWAWSFLRPLIRELLSDRGERLAAVAREVVADLEDSSLPGSERREAAVQRIRTLLREEWADIPTLLLHAVIEAAVLRIREREG